MLAVPVNPHLSQPLVSGRADYSDLVLTVQLECFVGSVRFIRVCKSRSV